MSKRRNWLRTTIAMLTLIATVLETGFSSVSTLAAEITTDDNIVVNTDAIENAQEEEAPADDVQTEEAADEDLKIEVVSDDNEEGEADAAEEDLRKGGASESEDVESADAEEAAEPEEEEPVEETSSEDITEDEAMLEETAEVTEDAAEEEVFEEADELKEGKLDVSDDGITGSGYDEISIYVDTENLAKKDKFRIEFTGPASASYNPVLNDELDKTNDGRYDFEDLEGGDFTVRATSSENVILSYRYNEDGYPTIYVESEPVEKILETRTLTTTEDTELQAVSGQGYESLTVEFKTDELSDKARFKLVVESDADATVDGYSAIDGITGLDKETGSLTIEGLDEESFTAYVLSDDDEIQIQTIADVDSVEDGVVVFTVDNVDTKRVYEFEDNKVKVTATLERADAVPDDAYFSVVPLSEEEGERYLSYLNENKEEDTPDFTADNTLLYDIAFYTDESKSEEIEPEEGSVSINVEFKNNQLEEELGAADEEEIEVIHITEDGSGLDAETLEVEQNGELDSVKVVTESFSIFVITARSGSQNVNVKNPGEESTEGLLGDAWTYGITANTWEFDGEAETNFAVKYFTGLGDNPLGGSGFHTGVSGIAGDSEYQYVKVGKVNGYATIKERECDLYIPESEKDKIDGNGTTVHKIITDKSVIDGEIDGMINYVSTVSSRLAGQDSVESYNNLPKAAYGDQNMTIDISTAPGGTYYIDVDKYQALKEAFAVQGKVTIVKNAGQKIVFNYTSSTTAVIRAFSVKQGDTTSTSQGMTTTATSTGMNPIVEDIIFNLPVATNVTLETVCGIVLAPQARVKWESGNSAGWLVCDKAVSGGEWHFLNGKLKKPNPPVPGKVKVKIPVNKKFIDGNGKWKNGFTFNFERINGNWQLDNDSQTPQTITLRAGDSDEATGYFELEFDDTIPGNVHWDRNNDRESFDNYEWVHTEWYRISELKDRSDVTYDLLDQLGYREWNGKFYDDDWNEIDPDYWYVHLFIYKDDQHGYYSGWGKDAEYKPVIRTARVNPNTFAWGQKKLPCDDNRPIWFKNKYNNPKTITITGKKLLNGSELNVPDGKFTFTLQPYGPNGWEAVTSEFTVTNNGEKFAFPEIELNLEDSQHVVTSSRNNTKYYYFYYKIKEVNNCAPYGPDDAVFIASVNVGKNRNGVWINNENEKPVIFKFSSDKAGAPWEVVEGADVSSLYFNNTYDATGEAEIFGHKTLVGRDMKVGDVFKFTMSSEDDDQDKATQEYTFTVTEENVDQVKTAGFDFKFDKLSYDLDDAGKTYHYKVLETKGNDTHIEYDKTEYTVTIGVADNKTGQLTITQDKGKNDSSRLSFTNTYSAKGDATFKATKLYKTESKLSHDKWFKFILEGGKVNGESITPQEEPIKGEGTVQFDTITFADINAVGTYKYTIREDIPSDAKVYNNDPTKKIKDGIIYDARIYHITVVVSDNGSGTLQKAIYGAYDKDPDETDLYDITEAGVDPEFTNDYELNEVTSDPIEGDKILHGKELTRGEYTFTISAFDDATKDAVKGGDVVLPATSVQNGVPDTLAVKQFKFDSITFKKEGTYRFLIVESVSDEDREENTVYSTDEYITTIVVKDNESGQLVVTSNTTSKQGASGNVGKIEFVNTHYNPGEIPLFAYKDLSGRDLEADQFTFYLRDASASSDATPLQTKTNKADGEVTFDPLEYKFKNLNLDKNGEQVFTYIIEEKIPEGAEKQDDGTYKLNGYTYDGHQETVHVTVKAVVDENGKRTGNLIVKADNAVKAENSVDGQEHKAEFNNSYEASGKTKFDGVKKITGRKFTDEDSGKLFADLYTVIDGNVSEKPVQHKEITKDTNIFGDYGAEFKFDEISYDHDGIYWYKVKESGTIAGVTNDTTVYNVKVTVTDKGDGTLTAANEFFREDDTKVDTLSFNNTFEAKNSTSFKAWKKVNGAVLQDKQFSFVLKDADGNEIQTKKNDAGGLVTFDPITYVQNDTRQDVDNSPFIYTISEVEKNLDGWTLSQAEYTVKVFLSLNEEDGTIKVDKRYYKPDATVEGGLVQIDEDATHVLFENTYTATGDVQPYAYKKLTGKDLAEGQFTFLLKDKAGNEVGRTTNEAAKAGKEAKATFGVITFDQTVFDDADTYKIGDNEYARYYTINEVVPDGATDLGDGFWEKDGYTYDGRTYNVLVTLEDEHNGHIKTDWVAYTDVLPDKENLLDYIKNKVKSLFGVPADNKHALFENKYAAEGKFKLGAIKKYVAVGDGDDNTEIELDPTGLFSFIFSGTDQPAVTKGIAKLDNGKFGVQFDEITYTEPGSFKYTLVEENAGNTVAGIEYSAKTYTIDVAVTDNGDGKLRVDATVTNNEDDTTETYSNAVQGEDGKFIINDELCSIAPPEIEFKNVLRYKPTEIAIGGTKEVTGRNPEDGEFWFVMENAEGNDKEYRSFKSNLNGAFTFDPISFTRDDLVDTAGNVTRYKESATFDYVIKEITPGNIGYYRDLMPEDAEFTELPGMKYDARKFPVTVTVTNVGGQLTATATDLNPAKFSNTYDADGNITFKVRKESENKKTADNNTEFSFELTSDDKSPIKVTTSDEPKAKLTATAKVNGEAGVFDTIKYDLKDLDPIEGGKYEKTFNYTVNEVKGNSSAYEYTEDYYKITVHVANFDESGKIDKTGKLHITKSIVPYTKGEDGKFTPGTPLEGNEIIMTFNNPYIAKGSVEIPGKKEVEGDLPDNTTFTFQLQQLVEGAWSDTIAPALVEKKAADGKVLIDAVNPKELSEGEFNYYIEYTQDDIGQTYYYKVDEVGDEDPAIVYDPGVYFIKVTVSDSDVPGQLKVERSIRHSADDTTESFEACGPDTYQTCTFTNTVVEPNSIRLKAHKTLEGKALGNLKFTFEVKEGNTVVTDKDGKELRETNNDGGDVTFAPIEYTLSDAGKTFEYTIVERADLLPKNITQVKDEAAGYLIEHNVKVKVERDGTGLVVTASLDGGQFKPLAEDGSIADVAQFKNKYEDKVSVQFGGLKNLVGFEGKDISGRFAFALYDESGNIVKVGDKDQIAYVDLSSKDLSFLFDEITYTQDEFQDENGKFDPNKTEVVKKYTLKEVRKGTPGVDIEDVPNVNYSTQTYHIQVTLSYDGDGLLHASVTTDEGVGSSETDAKRLTVLKGLGFTNVADADIVIDGTKVVTGKSLGDDGTYEFTLYENDNVVRVDANGRVVTSGGTEQIVTNVGNTFTFLPIKYGKEDVGVHTYTVKETAVNDNTTRDLSEYKVTVNVTADDTTGEIKAEKTVEGGKVEFTNTFAAEGETSLDVTKILKNKPLKADDFKFFLKDENGELIDTKGNGDAELVKGDDGYTATSTFTFEGYDEFKFTEESFKDGDNYLLDQPLKRYFTVTESYGNKTKANGFTIQDKVYVVELTATVTDELVEGKENVYKIKVDTKIGVSGTPVSSSKTGLAAIIARFTGNTDDTKAPDRIEFVNDYQASCKVDPPILTKQIMGRNVERGEFKFFVDSEDGLPSMNEFGKGYHREVRNGYGVTGKIMDDPGEIAVDDLLYLYTDLIAFEDAEWSDDGNEVKKEFVYIAKEDPKTVPEGVDNTPAVFELRFTVSDDSTGELHLTPSLEELKWEQVTKNAIPDDKYKDIFLNIYNMEGSAEIKGIKKMDGRELTKDDIFEFTIKDDNSDAEVTINNTPDAFGVPSEIIFNGDNVPFLNYKEGVFANDKNELIEIHDVSADKDVLSKDYTYTISEKLTNKNGVEYDKTTFKVTVTVTKVASAKDKGHLDARVTKVDKIISENNVERFGIADGNHFEFKNKFKATGEMSIDGIKNLVDTEGNALVSTDSMAGQYEFALYKYDDPTVRARKDAKGLLIDIATTAADGSFSLSEPKGYTEQDLREKDGSFKTDEPKTLLYKIVETKPSTARVNADGRIESDGVVYDDTEYYVDVTLKYNGTNQLDVTRTVTNAKTGEVIAQDIPVPNKVSVGFNNIVKKFTSVEGVKYWNDGENDPTKRPDVHVNLYSRTASDVVRKINTYTIKAPDTTYRFTTDSEGNKLATTDSAGRPIVYEVEEEPIEGYLSEQNGFDFYNSKGRILIRKIDADTRIPLAGAVLAIFDGSTEVERWTSGVSAHIVEASLTAGKTYILREISAPEGYGTAAEMSFTVPADGSGITVTMSDPPIIGSVRLTKRDEATRETLAGAEFALYNDAGTRIYATGSAGSYRATNMTSNGIFITDAAGTLTISDLPYGTYYFVETKAPDGYALSAERLGFTILRSGELVEVTFNDPKAYGSVRLLKVNEDGTRALAGAVFELYAATPRTVGQAATSTIFSDAYFRYGTYRTNSSGELYVEGLPWDDYYFIEVDAPTGYDTARDVDGSDLVYTFTIDRYSADRVIDLGGIRNTPETPPPPPTPPTPPVTPPTTPPTVPPTSPTPPAITTTPPPSGVLGARVERGGVVSGVLGVRAKPNSGVLGARVGPVTGDASNIILWLLLLAACVATIVATVMTGRKKKGAK